MQLCASHRSPYLLLDAEGGSVLMGAAALWRKPDLWHCMEHRRKASNTWPRLVSHTKNFCNLPLAVTALISKETIFIVEQDVLKELSNAITEGNALKLPEKLERAMQSQGVNWHRVFTDEQMTSSRSHTRSGCAAARSEGNGIIVED